MSTPPRNMDPKQQEPMANLGKVAQTLQKKFDKARTLGRIEGSIACIDSLLVLTKHFEENRGDHKTHQVYRHWLLVEKASLQNKAKNTCLEHEILPNPPPPISPEHQPLAEVVPAITRSENIDKPSNIRNPRTSNRNNRVRKPVRNSVRRPAKKPVSKPAREPVRKPVRNPTRRPAKKKVVIQTPPPPSPSPSLSSSESDTESDMSSPPPPPPSQTSGVRRSQRNLTVAARQPKVKEQSVKKSKGKGKAVAKPVKKVSKSILKKSTPKVVPEVDPVKRVGLRLTYKAGGFM